MTTTNENYKKKSRSQGATDSLPINYDNEK